MWEMGDAGTWRTSSSALAEGPVRGQQEVGGCLGPLLYPCKEPSGDMSLLCHF